MRKKEELRMVLEKVLPKLQEVNDETVRRALQTILSRLGFERFLPAVEKCAKPLEFAYNLYLYSTGCSKELPRAPKMKKGLTNRERMAKQGFTEDEIVKKEKKRDGYKNNAFGRLSEIQEGGWIDLSKKTFVPQGGPEFETWEEALVYNKGKAPKSRIRTEW